MRFAAIFVLAAGAFAQQNPPAVAPGMSDEAARALLRRVADFAHDLKSFSAEGDIKADVSRDGQQSSFETHFTLLIQRPSLSRFETKGGATPQVDVCDATAHWTYLPLVGRFAKSLFTPEACDPLLSHWEQIADKLKSAKFRGRETVQFEGKAVDCAVIDANYAGQSPRLPGVVGGFSSEFSRTVWIDPARNLILRDKVITKLLAPSPGEIAVTASYARIAVNPMLEMQSFEFKPPSPDSTHPTVISKTDPIYTDEARRAKLSGSVLLGLVVDAAGLPTDIKVIRSIGLGLDEKAVEAVQKWRFKPAEKDGNPIAAKATVEVTFRLLDSPDR